MRTQMALALSSIVLGVALLTGCNDASANADETNGAAEADLTQASTDAAIEGKLRGILKDVSFTSESDFGYVVFEGDAVTEKRLTTKLVRQKLQAAVKAQSSDKRDILPSTCRANRINIGQTIASGDAAVVPVNRDDDDFTSSFHDKQLGIALKVMRSQLRGLVAFTFGTNASGDQDEFGTVLFVYVGISKTTGKLIAIMTEAVFT
jgi:hypothetical protein